MNLTGNIQKGAFIESDEELERETVVLEGPPLEALPRTVALRLR